MNRIDRLSKAKDSAEEVEDDDEDEEFVNLLADDITKQWMSELNAFRSSHVISKRNEDENTKAVGEHSEDDDEDHDSDYEDVDEDDEDDEDEDEDDDMEENELYEVEDDNNDAAVNAVAHKIASKQQSDEVEDIPETEQDRRVARVLTRQQLISLISLLPLKLGIKPQSRHGNRVCVGMVGYPNVGKSSVINTILGVSKSSHG